MKPMVTIGETMAQLATVETGPLRHADLLRLRIGGAESNVAIGVCRLGASAAWIGRVGADELGELILRTLRAERVDTRAARTDPDVPTSLMIKERRTGATTRVTYYRAGGPGARLAPSDVDRELVAAAGVLHVTGITLALSASAAAAVDAAIDAARAAGVPVSLDVNHRASLWSAEAARAAIDARLPRTDVCFIGLDEAAALGYDGGRQQQGDDRQVERADQDHDRPAGRAPGATASHGGDAEAVGRRIQALGPQTVVVKLGRRGALAVAESETIEVPPVDVPAVDAVGAGDAFCAGYLAELLAGRPLAQRLSTAAACGAYAVTAAGDWEALPSRTELALLAAEAGTVLR